MNELIHRIVGVIIEAGQSDTKKFRLGETIRYSPSEILEILKQHENEIFGEESSTQPNTSNTLNALDCISRSMALTEIRHLYPSAPSINFRGSLVRWSEKNKQYIECEEVIRRLPPAQPEQRWIPCDKGKPDPYRRVLMTERRPDWNGKEYYFVTLDSFCNHRGDVVAWMLPPDPYKEN